ncbi:uncharacterized protein TrAtP1_003755 [Trichoderma atroviride]|uniref:uncharacterized protein n=1 Tax=Hypocrea atroviridis TaxID=63577 RepID=UPI00331FB134|nr:hypothetical protein TrAtP1_003755 [Trichoderma atroviride]
MDRAKTGRSRAGELRRMEHAVAVELQHGGTWSRYKRAPVRTTGHGVDNIRLKTETCNQEEPRSLTES